MFTLYPYQKEALICIFNFYRKKVGKRPIVCAPTGSGKSVMIAGLCGKVNLEWKKKILVLSHDKEILRQDYLTIKKHLNNLEIGLYSAGLNIKTIEDITVAGIQSVYRKKELFEVFDIIVVDECHAIPMKKDSMYRKFFDEEKRPLIGFSATPYKMGSGFLHLGKDAFFDDLVYDIKMGFLQDEGFLCKFTTKQTTTQLDTTDIPKHSGGDFIEKKLSEEFDREYITEEIVRELVKYKKVRKKWLIFGIDIKHVENITSVLIKYGVKAKAVHSETGEDRTEVIADFKNNKYQALVSVAMLTTGVDIPEVDLVGLLRPTNSPNLHVQIIGRGGRIAVGKKDCLVLDFAGNIFRNGPVDNPVIKLKGKGGGEPIMKACGECEEIVHAAVRVCPDCGYEFKFRHKLVKKATGEEVISKEEWWDVSSVSYLERVGRAGIPMLYVTYACGVRPFSEYVCLEHSGYAKGQAQWWWKRRSKTEVIPNTVKDAIELIKDLKEPKKILINEAEKFPVSDYEF